MKLILCLDCLDVVRLIQGKRRSCECGGCSGLYVDDLNAEIEGPCVPIGMANGSLASAIRRRTEPGGYGPRFETFVIPPDARSVVHINPPTERMDAIYDREDAWRIELFNALEANRGE